jgi:hypothetical protein
MWSFVQCILQLLIYVACSSTHQLGVATAVSSELVCLRLDFCAALMQMHSPDCQSKQRADPSS